ncbi:hypothetical protein KGM_214893 [Danaus plexippus plexippus]|uniref:Ommochrome-binding protein-like n=1 Tax=Danaus plexippus plexippus TaxID=278856 RepID=A0A212F6C0_DANPL|nr:hypothetical protein KGM_214893 [Danaus plexippus plexippus]
MRALAFLCIVLLKGSCHAAPLSGDNDEKIVIPRQLFDKSLVKYKAKHDIVDIIVPLNALNFESSYFVRLSESESDENDLTDVTVFIVEADLKDGKRVDQGLYLYKNDEVKMILPNGRAAAASFADNKLVYFGASDGLYLYNVSSKAADKYGEISDSIIDIATNKAGKHIYILSEDHKLYNVTKDGENKELLDEVEDAMEFVLDDSENIYFYNSNKEVFIKNADGIKKIQGLPKGAQSVKLINPPFIMEESVPLMLDNALYIVYANGTSDAAGLEFSPNAKPTAYGADAVFVQYYSYNKNLYEFNLIALIAEKIFEKFHVQAENIRSNAEKGKNSLGS